MALLTLKDVGKIYVSEGSVAVGIRGVNLSFDRGEFVAVTGKSGSGKSTLLNVISGMDSYEEGELYIEGEQTSHYLQPEWEEYRERYISFIFQDYNIIESFTVLENVELALMHITDKRKRRARALELIDRVGLTSHAKHKGSKLSGGQKQRTVIARALAKDSPIILADEPTGNLDSATSKEIIELLYEVSRDKLLIVVTHNFEQVEDCATRHIRIFDGAVESDHEIRAAEKIDGNTLTRVKKTKGEIRRRDIKNGFTLGGSIYRAKPRLSVFLSLLMIIGMLGIFAVTSLCGEATEMLEPSYMFRHIDGRVVVTTPEGRPLTNDEIVKLAADYGAERYLRFDSLLDAGSYMGYVSFLTNDRNYTPSFRTEFTYSEHFGDDIIGHYPENASEVFLYLPIEHQTDVGADSLLLDKLIVSGTTLYRVSGVKYFYDNNKTAKCLFTEEGFRTATAASYISSGGVSISYSLRIDGGDHSLSIYSIVPSFEIEDGKAYVHDQNYDYLQSLKKPGYTINDEGLTLSAYYYKYDYNYGDEGKALTFEHRFSDEELTTVKPDAPVLSYMGYTSALIVSDELLREIAESVLDKSYRQASLFFEDDKAAEEAAELMQEAGYIAVPSNTTYTPDAETTLMNVLACLALAAVWFVAVVFLAFFINLCSGRALGAFRGDMAIMRSMGIPVRAIRVGMYVRMLLSIIPALILLLAVALTVFRVPVLNPIFVYLYWWQYALIVLGMLLLTVRTTHKQIKRLFGESVKKSLKGGDAQ